MKLANIKETNKFKKDLETGALVSVDNQGLAIYKKSKEMRMNQINEINNMRREIDELKSLIICLIEKMER